jgi:hypothetical protein
MRSGPPSVTVARFELAPMSTGIRILTWIVLALPLALLLGARQADGAAGRVLLGVTVFLLLLYASVWLWWRPTAFEIDPAGLRIRWPLRARLIPARELADAVVLSGGAFRREFGWGVRVGAGGLWGGFGWLCTRKGLVDLYVSRADHFVLVTLRTGRPLLLTPDADQRFVATLRAAATRFRESRQPVD